MVRFDIIFFFFQPKTAYDMRISDWSSDVCSSDLHRDLRAHEPEVERALEGAMAEHEFFVQDRGALRGRPGQGVQASLLLAARALLGMRLGGFVRIDRTSGV